MRMGTFSGSLVYAAVAALATIPYLMLARPLLGSTTAWSTCCVAMVVGYLIAIAPNWARGIRVGLMAGAFGLGIVLFAPGLESTVLGCAVLLGLLRSGIVFRGATGRELFVETGLLAGGLVLANILAGAGVLSLALAVWGFFLIQSLYFLVGGMARHDVREEHTDPFERARKQAVRLMDDFAL